MDTSIIIIIIIVIVILFLLNNNKEKYGAIIQSQPYEFPQDNHLYPYYPRFNRFLWNEPTRFTRNSAPYLWLTPERNVLF